MGYMAPKYIVLGEFLTCFYFVGEKSPWLFCELLQFRSMRRNWGTVRRRCYCRNLFALLQQYWLQKENIMKRLQKKTIKTWPVIFSDADRKAKAQFRLRVKRDISGSKSFGCYTNRRKAGKNLQLNSSLNIVQEWRKRWMLTSGE